MSSRGKRVIRRGARIAKVTGIAAATCALAAACGSANGPSTALTPSATADITVPSIAALVPTAIRDKGTLTIATDASYAPDEFIATDGTSIIGMDVDLAYAVGTVLGLKIHFVNVNSDAIISGLKSGKYDMSFGSWTDTKAREQDVDFVTYFTAGTSFMVRLGSGVTVNTRADLCGKTVSVEDATTELSDAQAQNTVCLQEGKPAVQILSFPDQNSADRALADGRAQVGMLDSPVAAYQVSQGNGQFTEAGQAYGEAPYGVEIPKGNGMARAVHAAMQEIMADGTYRQVLDMWGERSGAISESVINGATS
jgi:polar amino acid transport system substrate-binding protein